MYTYVTYEFKFCKAKLNFLSHRRKFKFLNSNIARLVHCKGQVINEYCHMWFMNSYFSLHKVSRYWTCSRIKTKLCNATGWIHVMCSNKPDILYKPELYMCHVQLTHRCICINIHLVVPLMNDVTIVYICDNGSVKIDHVSADYTELYFH